MFQFQNICRSQDKLFNSSPGTNLCLLLLFQIKSRATGTLEEMRLMWKPLATYCSLKSSSAALVMLVLLWRIWPIRDRVVLDLFPLRFGTTATRIRSIIWSLNVTGDHYIMEILKILKKNIFLSILQSYKRIVYFLNWLPLCLLDYFTTLLISLMCGTIWLVILGFLYCYKNIHVPLLKHGFPS